mmetsp:Transcript_79191/g.173646  ORF Transcript_79191/g.173646 Transcript_79191/m.173646 type:complete len:284 (+) Transcript_79191:948-1799(+)
MFIPFLRPKKPETDEEGDDRGDVGEGNRRECPWPQQGRCWSVVAQFTSGLGECHCPDHDHPDANVHCHPHVLPQIQSAMPHQNGSNGGECEGIDHEILEGGHVGGKACSTLTDEIHDCHQRLAISTSCEGRHHGCFCIRQCQPCMRSTETTAIVASITAHSYDQCSTLEVLHDVDFVLWLHAGKDHDAVPDLFQLGQVLVKVSPSTLRDRQLPIAVQSRVDVQRLGRVAVGVAPLDALAARDELPEEHAAGVAADDDVALLADGDACQCIVASAYHRADGTFA